MNGRLSILLTVLLTAALGACAGAGKTPREWSPEPGCIGLERLSAQVSIRSGGFLLPDPEASDRLRDHLRDGLQASLGARLYENRGQWPRQATALYDRVAEVALTRGGSDSLDGLSVGALPQANDGRSSCPQQLVLQALVLPSSPGMAQLNLTLGLVSTSSGDLLQLRHGTLPTSADQIPKESLARLLERWLGSYRG